MLRISKKDTFHTFQTCSSALPSLVGLPLLHICSLKPGANEAEMFSFRPSFLPHCVSSRNRETELHCDWLFTVARHRKRCLDGNNC